MLFRDLRKKILPNLPNWQIASFFCDFQRVVGNDLKSFIIYRTRSRVLCSFPTDREPGQNLHAQGQPRAEGRERVGGALRGEVVLVAVSGADPS